MVASIICILLGFALWVVALMLEDQDRPYQRRLADLGFTLGFTLLVFGIIGLAFAWAFG